MYALQGVISIGGAALGVGIETDTGWIRPSFEWTRFARRHRAGADAPAFEAFDVWTFSLAWEH